MTKAITLKMPLEPLFVGAYAKVSVTIDPKSSLSIDDLDFIVLPGPEGGEVSISHEKSFDKSKPDIMLLAGHQPGYYQLQAVERSTHQILDIAKFEVTTFWKNEKEGPSFWTSGVYEMASISPYIWGGGDPNMPDNFDVTPLHKEKKRVAILLIDTDSQRFNQSDIPNITTLWQDIAFNGRTINGKTVSAAHYYREVSHDNLDIVGDVFGTVSLPGNWEDYIQSNGNQKGNFWPACIAAGDQLINYLNYDCVVFAVQSVDATQTEKEKKAWAHSLDSISKTADAERDLMLPLIAIPANGDPFSICADFIHELGHSICRWGDQYPWTDWVDSNGQNHEGHPEQIQRRTPGDWDIMAYQGGIPHPVLVHRMRVGWVNKDSIKLYNFKELGVTDEIVTLYPVELDNPPVGEYSGIEIRIKPGWDYYFEYRKAQGNQIGDQHLPLDNRILGTDVMMENDLETVVRRKPILLLRSDSDGDGPILGAGQDFEIQDISATIPADFSAYVINNDGTKADVRIRYGVSSHPDPSIRQWNPPPWQSPDIEIRNEKTEADPAWANTPWENHHNRVIAKVTNRGKLDAKGVLVNFYAYDFTVTYPPNPSVEPFFIGDDLKDVPAGQTVEFETIWMPLKSGHYCIEVRIQHYQTPGPNSVIEATEYNNKANSNYTRFISETASPPTREVTSVEVYNPLDMPVCAYAHVSKSTNPLFRTYIGQRWLELQPKEAKKVDLMFEYIPGKSQFVDDKYMIIPNDVSIHFELQTYGHYKKSTRMVLGGVSVQIVTGRTTKIERFVFDSLGLYGEVKTVDTGEYVKGGKIIVCFRISGNAEYRTESVSTKGLFSVRVPDSWDTAQAFYIPSSGYAESESDILSNNM